LHAAGVGAGFEDPALRGFLAGAAGKTAFRPRLADAQAVAALRDRRTRRIRETALKGQNIFIRCPELGAAP
jgi:hypothetical protein